ncbi:MAG TPA: hypothetical protein VMU16_11865 [Candidatus Binataceae bacterium]|nr:hypothetical protein [Candidatus Binataceae bacterium]
MKIVLLAAPAIAIAAVTLIAPHAQAQTMGEYAAVTSSSSTGAQAGAASVPNESPAFDISNSNSGGTWGASKLGESWDERAGSASGGGSGGGDFESRAGGSAGAGGSSRWPQQSGLAQQGGGGGGGGGGGSDRFAEASDRFGNTDQRFGESKGLDQGDRFPSSSFHDNSGVDNSFNQNP